MSVLDTIIARKRREVLALPDVSAVPTERSFVQALKSTSPALIAEVKPKSPSRGHLFDLKNLPELLFVYNQHAQAISVLCDKEDFGGGYDLLKRVREGTVLPILAKEFIVDKKQIRCARNSGADAILLIGAVLTKEEAQVLAEEAVRLKMGILFELHDESDIERIPALSSETLILGMNNRNLKDLSIDLWTTKRIARILRKKYPEHLTISESGIETKKDIERLKPFVDGFLIGTTFLQASNAETKMQELFPHMTAAPADPFDRLRVKGMLLGGGQKKTLGEDGSRRKSNVSPSNL